MRSAPQRAVTPAGAAWRSATAARSGPGRPGRILPAPAHQVPPPPRRAFAGGSEAGPHPLADAAASASLKARTDEIQQAFALIEPTLRDLAPRQFDAHFVSFAFDALRARLGIVMPLNALKSTWIKPLDMRRLQARCVLATFRRLIAREFDRGHALRSEGENAEQAIRRWGFHAVDITPCADGRLSGVIDYILRVPPPIIAFRKSYAGALFDVEETLRHWETVELRRSRDTHADAQPAPTRFLKIGVYHFSSADPRHEGCAAHGSDDARAAGALLERLRQAEQAVAAIHGESAAIATLLVGVDTDTDAIRVHVPDAAGRMSLDRLVDNLALHDATRDMPREEAKAAIRDAVARCAGVASDDPATEGMRWFCGYLLKNNLAQVDAVRQWHGAGYADRGHTERLIVVGDAVDDVQVRNLAFQAQMDTVEEGSRDLDVGVKILSSLNGPAGLAVPVLVHFRFDPRIPGGAEAARRRARRLRAAIESRFAGRVAAGELMVEAAIRAGDTCSLEQVDEDRPDDAPRPAESHA